MNVQMSKSWEFDCVIVSDLYDDPLINRYSVSLVFTTNCDDSTDYNTAYRRIKFWITQIMQDSVIINHDHAKISVWQNTGMRVLTIMDEPVDQLVGMMLFSKLQAICEDRVIINSLMISSSLDEDIGYHHDSDSDLSVFESSGWWNDARPTWEHHKSHKTRGNKVISIDRTQDWKKLDLGWSSEQGNVVLKADFGKDENQ
jgi:hypothetical protein